jgi:hypothetical protein
VALLEYLGRRKRSAGSPSAKPASITGSSRSSREPPGCRSAGPSHAAAIDVGHVRVDAQDGVGPAKQVGATGVAETCAARTPAGIEGQTEELVAVDEVARDELARAHTSAAADQSTGRRAAAVATGSRGSSLGHSRRSRRNRWGSCWAGRRPARATEAARTRGRHWSAPAHRTRPRRHRGTRSQEAQARSRCRSPGWGGVFLRRRPHMDSRRRLASHYRRPAPARSPPPRPGSQGQSGSAPRRATFQPFGRNYAEGGRRQEATGATVIYTLVTDTSNGGQLRSAVSTRAGSWAAPPPRPTCSAPRARRRGRASSSSTVKVISPMGYAKPRPGAQTERPGG